MQIVQRKIFPEITLQPNSS